MAVDVRVVAEAGMCDNDVGYAVRAADAAKAAGCWALKVQMLRPDTIASPGAAAYGRGLGTPALQRQIFEGALPYPAWAEVKEHCDSIGLEFFASCWDDEAVTYSLETLGCRWIKVGSGDITHLPLLALINTYRDASVILSTGASDMDEIGTALHYLQTVERIIIMACTLGYPTDFEHAALGRIPRLINWWTQELTWPQDGFGYSDHTWDVDTGALAVAAGATYLEKHFSLLPHGTGSGDHRFALRPDEMADYVGAAKRVAAVMGPDSETLASHEAPARVGARRSLHSVTAVEQGTTIEDAVLAGAAAWLRPAPVGAVTPDVDPSLRLRETVPAGTSITWEMIR